MSLSRSFLLRHRHRHLLRPYSATAAAAVDPSPPDSPAAAPAAAIDTIAAVPREGSGKRSAAKERKEGRVPSIVFSQEDGQHGGNKRLIAVQPNRIRNLVSNLGLPFFLSSLFNLEVRSEFRPDADLVEQVRVLPRLIHFHPIKDTPSNVTFIRAPSHALLKVDIPIVYRGEDVSPGLRKGCYLNTIRRTAKFLCPADLIPRSIELDLSELDAGQKFVVGDLMVHPELVPLLPKDHPVCKIMGARVSDQQKKSK